MRLVAVFLLGSAALLAAGCGNEDLRQTAARHAVEARIEQRPGYTGQVRCTHNPRPWFVEKEATVFICSARLAGGGCDLFRATLGNSGWGVVRDRRNGDCTLPQ